MAVLASFLGVAALTFTGSASTICGFNLQWQYSRHGRVLQPLPLMAVLVPCVAETQPYSKMAVLRTICGCDTALTSNGSAGTNCGCGTVQIVMAGPGSFLGVALLTGL